VEDEIFDLVYNDPGGWVFTYWNKNIPFGDDLADTVKFSLTLDNMEMPEYSYDRRKEKTVCVAFGPLLMGGGHDTWLIYGPDYTSMNDIETMLEIDNGVAANLYPRGKAYLNLMRARKKLRFQVLQQPGCYYGKHYDLGDRVGGRYEDTDLDLQIRGIKIDLQETDEIFQISLKQILL
jgi:hypothetical protein